MKLRYVPEMMNSIYQDNRKSGKCRLSSMLNAVSRTFRGEFRRIVLRQSYTDQCLITLQKKLKEFNIK